MAQKHTEKTLIKNMFKPPASLVEVTKQQQADAPYCGLGFKKSKLPVELHEKMLEKLEKSTALFRPETSIDVIQSQQADVIPVLYYEDPAFNDFVSQALKSDHESWSSMPLQESACYGFRAYQRGSYLHNHVDRTQTHIISSTICIDHRLNTPWPLYIEDISGKAYQVNMEPGELIFYEGARLIHGRPWALDGDYYVGMFAHYRPVLQGSRSVANP